MLLNQLYDYDIKVFIDYSQPHKTKEFQHCREYVTEIITLPKMVSVGKEVNCRNLTFISCVASTFGSQDIEIHLGTNAEDKYPDNSPQFYKELELMLNKVSIHKVRIVLPLKNMTKEQITNKLKSNCYTD